MNDDLTAEIAAHQRDDNPPSYSALRNHCILCGERWPCLVRRLADRFRGDDAMSDAREAAERLLVEAALHDADHPPEPMSEDIKTVVTALGAAERRAALLEALVERARDYHTMLVGEFIEKYGEGSEDQDCGQFLTIALASAGGPIVSGRCDTCGEVGSVWCGECAGPHPDDAVATREKLRADLAAAWAALAEAHQSRAHQQRRAADALAAISEALEQDSVYPMQKILREALIHGAGEQRAAAAPERRREERE